jgi:hypothetical protein
MQKIRKDSKPLRISYFWIGLIATFAYRAIIVLNYFEPVWVKLAWYVGTIGFIVYFWSRYKVVKQFSSLIENDELLSAVKKAKNISNSQRNSLAYIVKTLKTTKAKLNYEIIFVLSVIALLAGLVIDFVL